MWSWLVLCTCFLFRSFSVGCVFSSSLLRFVVALCFLRIISLRLNRFSQGRGRLVTCVIAGGFLSRCNFHFRRGRMPPHNPRQKWKFHRDRKPPAITHITSGPLPRENLLRRKEIIRKNTGPQQSATNKKKIHTQPKNYGIENKCTGPTTTTLTACELIQ